VLAKTEPETGTTQYSYYSGGLLQNKLDAKNQQIQSMSRRARPVQTIRPRHRRRSKAGLRHVRDISRKKRSKAR